MCISCKDQTKQIGLRFLFENLIKKDKLYHRKAEVILNLIPEFLSLSSEVHLIIPVRARQALDCMDSNFSNESLNV